MGTFYLEHCGVLAGLCEGRSCHICGTHGLSTSDSLFRRFGKIAPWDDWAFAEESQYPILRAFDGSHAMVMIGPQREDRQYRPLRTFDAIHALCISRNAMQATWRVVYGECAPPYLAGYANLRLLMKKGGLQKLGEVLAWEAKNTVLEKLSRSTARAKCALSWIFM